MSEFTAVLIGFMIAVCVAVWLNLWVESNADAPPDQRGWVFRVASGAFGAIRDALEHPVRWVERKVGR